MLSNGYEGEKCTQCAWYRHQCSNTIIYLVAALLIVVSMVSCAFILLVCDTIVASFFTASD